NYTGRGMFTLGISNLTTHEMSIFEQKSMKAGLQSAEWVMEAPWSGGVLPLANFGTIPFSGAQATLNGHTGGISDSAWQNDAISMVSSDGTTIKATPSALTATSTGDSFSVAWGHN